MSIILNSELAIGASVTDKNRAGTHSGALKQSQIMKVMSA